jgi:signal transduction histidine kinase
MESSEPSTDVSWSRRNSPEDELAHARRSEAIALLADGVAHELSGLLATILGFSDLVSDELGPGHPLQQQLAEIHDAAEHSAAVTKDLRAFAGRQMLDRKPIAASQLAESLQSRLRPTLGDQIELMIEDESDGALVLADDAQLEQALFYLALNARDAMPGGGLLRIRTTVVPGSVLPETPSRRVRISVSDSGTGISDEVRGRIFEPFFTTKDSGLGTGLGLAAVLGIVEQTGGRVTVDSTLGHGSTFVVELLESRSYEAG